MISHVNQSHTQILKVLIVSYQFYLLNSVVNDKKKDVDEYMGYLRKLVEIVKGFNMDSVGFD